MKNQLQPYKGTRDFYPEDKRLQTWMFSVMRRVVESYGYEEYDAPVLEPTELFTIKGSDEIVSEQSYTFTDRGGRSVTMRTEMTPSVSRLVAHRRQELAYPLRWYSIPNVWRYERPQKGRLREFWQLNVDLFGVEGSLADLEILEVADAIMRGYGAKPAMYSIRINSRRFMDAVLDKYVGLDDVEKSTIRRLIDKMHKMDYVEFGVSIEAAMNPTQRGDGSPEKLLRVLAANSIDALPEEIKDYPELVAIREVLEGLERVGISHAQFDTTLMRGFDYYTDIVFEVFDTDPENNRSMFGGGRYDGLVGLMGVDPIPTVGFGMGDATLLNFLEGHDLLPKLAPETQLFIAVTDKEVYAKASSQLKLLREEGVNVFVDITGRKISKQIEVASKKNIPWLIVIGGDELESGQYRLKNLQTGIEETHSLERIISIILADS